MGDGSKSFYMRPDRREQDTMTVKIIKVDGTYEYYTGIIKIKYFHSIIELTDYRYRVYEVIKDRGSQCDVQMVETRGY